MSAVRFLAFVKTTVPPVPLWLEVDATMLQKMKLSNVPYEVAWRECFLIDLLDIVSESLNGLVRLTNFGGTGSIIILSSSAWICGRTVYIPFDSSIRSYQILDNTDDVACGSSILASSTGCSSLSSLSVD